ncbi:MAG: putative 2OG-Fe(II) oxygenase [Caulobacter sp.]|nr:putative 2OG-Fe(II) oxygenase [Caulobacter sp.]
MSDQAAISREARRLLGAGRAEAALVATQAAADEPAANADLLCTHAETLKALGRAHEALAYNQRAVDREPGNRIAQYNLAATLGDVRLWTESEAAVRRAMALGLDRLEPYLVLGRSLTNQYRVAEAAAAFEACLERDPVSPDAHRDLAQLIWMETGDVTRALVRLNQALARSPGDQGLLRIKAIVQQFAGDLDAAIATLDAGVTTSGGHPGVLMDLAVLRLQAGDGGRALALARQVAARAPGVKPVLEILCQACLAAGEAAEAARIAEGLRASKPFDQMAIMLQATAWRLLGDARAETLDAADRFVRTWRLPTPAGWKDQPSFLADLSGVLRGLHNFSAHPLQQSLRGGTQAPNLLMSTEPTIQGFFRSLDTVLGEHIAWLGQGDDPVRARSTGRFRIKNAWSVLLRKDGYHVNHFHPEGWLSSAFYVETPAAAVDAGGREGWLKFGEPGFPTRPTVAPHHFVRPEPGLLALFPSFMWHGTVPFSSAESRMTIAFDVLPA